MGVYHSDTIYITQQAWFLGGFERSSHSGCVREQEHMHGCGIVEERLTKESCNSEALKKVTISSPDERHPPKLRCMERKSTYSEPVGKLLFEKQRILLFNRKLVNSKQAAKPGSELRQIFLLGQLGDPQMPAPQL